MEKLHNQDGERMPNLKDLIDAGILQVGEKLTCEPYKGEPRTAVLTADGSIHYDGVSFSSPFAWSTHLNPNKRDGWRTVEARGRTLRSFREELENSHKLQTGEVSRVAQIGSQGVSFNSLRRYILQLTPSEFQELAREYLKAKGFDDAVISITVRMKV